MLRVYIAKVEFRMPAPGPDVPDDAPGCAAEIEQSSRGVAVEAGRGNYLAHVAIARQPEFNVAIAVIALTRLGGRQRRTVAQDRQHDVAPGEEFPVLGTDDLGV